MSVSQNEFEQFNAKLVRIGTITILAGIVANFTPAIYVYLRYGIAPSIGTIGQMWVLLAASMGVGWFVQPLSFFPILGTSGTYIAWLAGNVADIRTPASIMAQKSADVEAGTIEGDMISTLGIATSVFVSVSIITFFTFVGASIIPHFPEFVKDSFKFILPTVFAGVYVDLTQKHKKFGLVVIAFCVAVAYIGPMLKLDSLLRTLLTVVGGMFLGYVFYKHELKNDVAK